MPRTVGQKATANYTKGIKGGSTRVTQTAKAATPGANQRRAVRTAIKAGIREKHPDLKASKVRGRAAKQTRAFMKKS